MSDHSQTAGGAGPSHAGVEIGVAVAMAAFGLIVIIGSLQVGIGWGAEGPRSGFFPFYIALLIVGASVVNLLRAVAEGRAEQLFAEWGQLRQVMAVVIPTTVYVAVIPYAGIYVSSIVLIIVFMIWIGKYNWRFSAVIGFGVMIATYLMFEKWFLVPLPKGPVEDFLAGMGWS